MPNRREKFKNNIFKKYIVNRFSLFSLKHMTFLLIFIFLGMLLIQAKRQNSLDVSIGNQRSIKLKDAILREESKIAKVSKRIKEMNLKLNQIKDKNRKEVSQNNEDIQKLRKELEDNNKILGYSKVSGKGVLITLKENLNKIRKNGISENNIIHNTDLLDIVNLLKNAGAEAIEINNQRIACNTSINCIGVVININNEKISSPFYIKAIGNPDVLDQALRMPNGIISLLKNFEIDVKITKSNDIKINDINSHY